MPPLEEFVPEDYPLRRLHRVLDLSFVHEMVRNRYCQDNGRPSIDPEVIIRLFLLQAIADIPHLRELLREVQVNLAYRWFIGYEIDEPLPDHSTLSKALTRFGDEVFNEVFQRSIGQCRQSGLIEGQVLHVDATTIRADLDKEKVNKPGSADPDARYGRFGDGSLQPGYKQQTVADDASRVVLAIEVHPANESEHESAVTVIDAALAQLAQPAGVVCADAAYASGENKAALEARGIRLVSPPPKLASHRGDQYFTVEDFVYDENRDRFVCPAGEVLRYRGSERVKGQQRRQYYAERSRCQRCALKSGCTQGNQRKVKVSAYHGALIRLRADSHSEDFQQLYRTRAPVIEGIFAEAKQWHGLRRAWRRGLAKMRIQCLLIAAALNFKRLAAAFLRLLWSLEVILTFLRRFLDVLRRRWQKIFTPHHRRRILYMTP